MRWSLVARNNFGPQVYWGDCFTHGSCYILRADERGGGNRWGSILIRSKLRGWFSV